MSLLNAFRTISALGVGMLALSMVLAWLTRYDDVLPEALFIAAVAALAVGALGMFVIGLQ